MRLAAGRTELALALVAVFAGGYLLWLVVASPLLVSRDAALYLESAMVLLEGGIPYVDFVDLNPPLAQLLHVPPVWLAQQACVNPINVFYLLLLAATFVSAALTYSLVLRLPFGRNPYAALCVALTPAICLLLINSYMQLGQRVQLFLLALLPYIFLRLCRYEDARIPVPLSIGIAVLLAFTANLKPPHYGSIIIAVELYLAAHHATLARLLKPETLTLAVLTVLYPAGLFLLMPLPSQQVFFNELLPLILESYSAYNPPAADLWLSAWLQLTPAFAVIAFCHYAARQAGVAGLNRILSITLIVALVGLYTYMAQAKGWKYHATPTEFAGMLAAASLAGGLVGRLLTPTGPAPVLRCGLMLCLALIGAGIINTQLVAQNARKELNSELADIIRSYTLPGDRVLILGTSANPQYPLLLQMERRSGSRYPFSFMVPLLYEGAQRIEALPRNYRLVSEARNALEEDYIRNLNDDIGRLEPEIVMILNFQKCFDCLEDLSMTSYVYGFKTQFTFLDDYENVDPAAGYIILRRIPRDG